MHKIIFPFQGEFRVRAEMIHGHDIVGCFEVVLDIHVPGGSIYSVICIRIKYIMFVSNRNIFFFGLAFEEEAFNSFAFFTQENVRKNLVLCICTS